MAFIKIRKPNGEALQLEPNTDFAHVAIRYKNQWLHAAPGRGVELMSDLASIGEVTMLRSEVAPDLTEAQIQKYLSLPYDPTFRWEDSHSTYCSKLVAQILEEINLLRLELTPMNFSGPNWEHIPNLPRGEIGISPDELFVALRNQGFSRTKPFYCPEIFNLF